jgi:peptidoglycan hydrolase FlgJ
MSSDLPLLPAQPITVTATTDATSASGAATGNKAQEIAKVKDLAQQFEGMLLLQMIKDMRKSLGTTDGDGDGTGDGGSGAGGLLSGSDTMTDTTDAAFAQQLAKAGGFGLSAALVKTLQQQIDAAGGNSSSGLSMGQQLEMAAKAQGLTMGTPQTPALTLGNRPGLVIGNVPGLVMPAPASPATPGQTPAAPAGTTAAVPGGGPTPQEVSAALPDLSGVLDATVTSQYGWRADPFNGEMKFHSGVDLRAAYGTPVPVVGPGEVKFAGDEGGYGLTVVVQHADGTETRYAHLSSLDVQAGQQVTAGQTIGRVGMTGRATGPHLHFEVTENGRRVNPEQVALQLGVKFKSVATNAD